MKKDNSKIKGIIGTLIVHAVALALLFLLVMRSPAQEEESGMEVMLGDVPMAKGEQEPYQFTEVEAVKPDVAPDTKVVENTAPPVKEEPIITQKAEETVAVKTVEKTEAEKKAEAEKQAAQKAAAQMANAFGKSSQMAAKGNTEGTSGTQGSAEGSPNSANASGNGTQGSWDLGGRSLMGSLPIPSDNVQAEGRVVVNITVNPAGEVIATNINVGRTNTSDARLREAAEKAAKRARFNNITSGENQVGTIIYYFKLR